MEVVIHNIDIIHRRKSTTRIRVCGYRRVEGNRFPFLIDTILAGSSFLETYHTVNVEDVQSDLATQIHKLLGDDSVVQDEIRRMLNKGESL